MFQACFSTPGSLAQSARELANAARTLQIRCSLLQANRGLAGSARARAMSLPSAGATPRVPTPDNVLEERLEIQNLYQEQSSLLVRQLTRRMGCREAARELVNETFLKLVRLAPGRLAQIDRPEAFLRQVSNNLLNDWGRTRIFRRASQPTLEILAEQTFDQVAVLESRDTLRRLEVAIAKMRPKTREIFLAHRIEGLTYAEIAKRTGLSVKGVEKHMSKAIAKISQLMDRG